MPYDFPVRPFRDGGPPAFLPGLRPRDGSPVNRDLRDYLVGQEIEDVDYRAQTEEGWSVVKIRFRGGDEMLIVPQPVTDEQTRQRTGLSIALRFTFHPRYQRTLWTPGVSRDAD